MKLWATNFIHLIQKYNIHKKMWLVYNRPDHLKSPAYPSGKTCLFKLHAKNDDYNDSIQIPFQFPKY